MSGMNGRVHDWEKVPDSLETRIGKSLLDAVKKAGFTFARTGYGPDAPIKAVRRLGETFTDTVFLGDFDKDCWATRQRSSPLIVTGSARIELTVTGRAIDVLFTVLGWPDENWP